MSVGIGSVDRHVVFMKRKGLVKESAEVAPSAVLVHRQEVVEAVVHRPAQRMVVWPGKIGIAAVTAGLDLPFEVFRDVEAEFLHKRTLSTNGAYDLRFSRNSSSEGLKATTIATVFIVLWLHRTVQEGVHPEINCEEIKLAATAYLLGKQNLPVNLRISGTPEPVYFFLMDKPHKVHAHMVLEVNNLRRILREDRVRPY